MKLILLAICLTLALAAEQLVNDPAFISEINHKATWKARANPLFDGLTRVDARHYLGLLKRPTEYFKLPLMTLPKTALPDQFDAREKWAGRIIAIRDQASCGSCWAFGATEALSDVFNIKYPDDDAVILSPQQLVSCDSSSYGCQGGYPDKAWDYMAKTGVVTDDCYPYTSSEGETGDCLLNTVAPKEDCPSGSGQTVVYHATAQGRIAKDVNSIMTAMYTYGPIEMGFHVYSDFMNYQSGVYYHVSGSLEGGHAIKCLGWGKDAKTGLDYWICANSWGTSWGIDGYFWIKKGTDECGIESWFTVGGQAGEIVH